MLRTYVISYGLISVYKYKLFIRFIEYGYYNIKYYGPAFPIYNIHSLICHIVITNEPYFSYI